MSSGYNASDASYLRPSSYGAKLGETITLTIVSSVGMLDHNLYYAVGSITGTIATGVSRSCAWTIPVTSLMNVVSSSGTDCVLKVVSINHMTGVTVGERTVTVKLYPADGMAPQIQPGWVSAARDNSACPNVNAWVKGYSKAKITFDPTKVSSKYASIARYSIIYGGTRTDAVENTATTGTLTEVDAKVKCLVTDSRGVTTVEEITIPVLDYEPPVITEVSIFRSDDAKLPADTGVHMAAQGTARFSALGGENACTLTASYKATSDAAFGTAQQLENGVLTMITGTAEIDTNKSYLVRLTATDKVGNATIYEKTVPTSAVTFHLKDGGNGAAFGKYAEKNNMLECQWGATFGGDVEFQGAVNLKDTDDEDAKTLEDYIKEVVAPLLTFPSVVDLFYPVGSIYTTTAETDPNTLFPDTVWARIDGGKFLLNADSTHAARTTGGAENVTLTVDQIPGHTHDGTTEWAGGTHTHAIPNIAQGGSGSGAYAESWGGGSGGRELSTDTGSDRHLHTFTTNAAGGGSAHSNMPPYLAVYMWERTA